MNKGKKFNTQKGITLIALVITIIVMLILVGVTITMAVNGGLFEYARSAATQTNDAKRQEQLIAEGKVEVGEKVYNTIDEYVEEIKGKGGVIEPANKADWEYTETNGAITITAYNGDDTNLIIPNHIDGVPVKQVGNGSSIFEWESIICRIGTVPEEGNKKIQSVIVSEGIEVIGKNAFERGWTISSVVFPSSIVAIGERAFYACNDLNGISIPESVGTVGASAFYFCNGIDITVAWDTRPEGWDANWDAGKDLDFRNQDA